MQSITNLIVDYTKFNLTRKPCGLNECVSDLIYGKLILNSIWVMLDTHVGLSKRFGSLCILHTECRSLVLSET